MTPGAHGLGLAACCDAYVAGLDSIRLRISSRVEGRAGGGTSGKAIVRWAVGQGVAFPHVRAFVAGATALAFARLEEPVDFEATDGQAVDVVLMLIAPYDLRGAFYQPLLAVLADLLSSEEGRGMLRAVERFSDLERFLRETVWPRMLEALRQ